MAYSTFWSRRFRSFLNPLRILKKIKSFEDLKYALKLVQVGVGLKLSQIKRHKFTPQMVYKDYDKCQSRTSD